MPRPRRCARHAFRRGSAERPQPHGTPRSKRGQPLGSRSRWPRRVRPRQSPGAGKTLVRRAAQPTRTPSAFRRPDGRTLGIGPGHPRDRRRREGETGFATAPPPTCSIGPSPGGRLPAVQGHPLRVPRAAGGVVPVPRSQDAAPGDRVPRRQRARGPRPRRRWHWRGWMTRRWATGPAALTPGMLRLRWHRTSGSSTAHSYVDLAVILDDLASPWDELRRMDEILWQHTLGRPGQ